jgi:hypothetical protein
MNKLTRIVFIPQKHPEPYLSDPKMHGCMIDILNLIFL